nr:hypothetical protein [Rhodococcus wratislaviensis]
MAYFACQSAVFCSAVFCSARAASWAACSSAGGTVSWPPRVAEVHWARTGHGRQVAVPNLITIASVPRWRQGLHEELVWPCGHRAVRVSKSMRKAARSNPPPARARGGGIGQQRADQRDPVVAAGCDHQRHRRVARVHVELGGQQVAVRQRLVDRGGHRHVRHGGVGGGHVRDQVGWLVATHGARAGGLAVPHRGDHVGGIGARLTARGHQAQLGKPRQQRIQRHLLQPVLGKLGAELRQHAVVEPRSVQLQRETVFPVDAGGHRLGGLPVSEVLGVLQHRHHRQLPRRDPRLAAHPERRGELLFVEQRTELVSHAIASDLFGNAARAVLTVSSETSAGRRGRIVTTHPILRPDRDQRKTTAARSSDRTINRHGTTVGVSPKIRQQGRGPGLRVRTSGV